MPSLQSPLWRGLLSALVGVGLGMVAVALLRLRDWPNQYQATLITGFTLLVVGAIGLLYLQVSRRRIG